MKRILLVLGAAVLFLNTLVVPTVVRADGGGSGDELWPDLVQAVIAQYARKICELSTNSLILQKPNKNHADVVACSGSRYSASLPPCCRRTHYFGTIFGSRRICLLAVLGSHSAGRRGLAEQVPAFSSLSPF